MALLVTSTIFGLLSFSAAIALQFSLPGWQFLAGLRHAGNGRTANIDVPRLRRRLSVVFYILAGGFLSGAVLLSIRAVSGRLLVLFLIILVMCAFNAVWFLYRKFDKNPRSDAVRRTGRLYLALSNLLFLAVFVLFLR